jgi:hypothetical protein
VLALERCEVLEQVFHHVAVGRFEVGAGLSIWEGKSFEHVLLEVDFLLFVVVSMR